MMVIRQKRSKLTVVQKFANGGIGEASDLLTWTDHIWGKRRGKTSNMIRRTKIFDDVSPCELFRCEVRCCGTAHIHAGAKSRGVKTGTFSM